MFLLVHLVLSKKTLSIMNRLVTSHEAVRTTSYRPAHIIGNTRTSGKSDARITAVFGMKSSENPNSGFLTVPDLEFLLVDINQCPIRAWKTRHPK